jgi:hypothetical protein
MTQECTRGYRAKWCCNLDTGRSWPFDIRSVYTSKPPHTPLPVIDECDGAQHFVQVSNWTPPRETQERDAYKILCALQNGHHVRRQAQDDVWHDRYDWRDWLSVTGRILAKQTTPVVVVPNVSDCGVDGRWEAMLNMLRQMVVTQPGMTLVVMHIAVGIAACNTT